MTCTRPFLLALLLSLALTWPANDTLARGSSGGGGRSSFSSSSRSSSSFSSSRSSTGSSWGSSNSSSSWGSSTSSRPSAPASAADSALATKVNRAGTTTSRTYATEPATRPADIPWGQTLPNGGYAPIYYDSAHQGYGFWNAAGQWMMWSAILNSGGHNNYYYGSGYGPGYAPYQHHSIWPTLLGLLILGGIVVAAIYIYRQHADEIGSRLDRNPQPDAFASYTTSARPMNSIPAPTRPASLAPWLHFPPGSFITLSDSQSMEDSQKRGEGFQGIRFAVESTLVANDTEGFASWVMLQLNDNHQRLMLVVKAVDNALDHRIYYANEDFHPARREEVVRRGDTWLFEAPEDEHNFEASDLRYAAEIVQTLGERVITYVRKDQGERHANATETPNPLGLTQQIATVVEYATSDATDNPELLVLEIGAASRRTGEVTLYLGCPIRESEIDVLKAAGV
ncbi:MAG: hypothetical protein WCO68_01130 [Verrucomicrobiota bacterium]